MPAASSSGLVCHMVVVVWSLWSCVSVCACVCKPEIRVERAACPRSQIGWRLRDESCRVRGARPFATSRLALPSGVWRGRGASGGRRSGMRPHPLHIKSVRSKVRPRGAGKPSAEHLLSLYPVPHVEQCYFCSFWVRAIVGRREDPLGRSFIFFGNGHSIPFTVTVARQGK